MPKKLYGHKNAKTRAPSCSRDDSIWLTLRSGMPDEKKHTEIIAALHEVGLSISDNLQDTFAAGLIEYSIARSADCDEAWIGVITELCFDLGMSLG